MTGSKHDGEDITLIVLIILFWLLVFWTLICYIERLAQ
jgi:hypothetical protein